MTRDAAIIERFRAVARASDYIDEASYTACGRDPTEPMLESNASQAKVCVLGREPGIKEVGERRSFTGHAGQRIREIVDDFALETAGGFSDPIAPTCLLHNAVPYRTVAKPACCADAMRAFHSRTLEFLSSSWHGRDVITVGPEAFFWFAINQPAAARQRLEKFWAKGAVRYVISIECRIDTSDVQKRFILHPLPHPSRRNARWYSSFPILMRCRLDDIFG